jgi:hypothetical protein
MPRRPARAPPRVRRPSAALAAAALAAATLAAGCVYGSYGDRGGQIGERVPPFVTPGKTRLAEVLAKLGEPDSTAISGTNEVLFYRATSGWYAVVVGRRTRDDLILRSEDGVIVAAEARRSGTATGVLLPPFGDER